MVTKSGKRNAPEKRAFSSFFRGFFTACLRCGRSLPFLGRSPVVPRGVLLLPVLAGLLWGCGARIRDLYETTRQQVLADPGPVPSSWSPHAVLLVDWAPVQDMTATVLEKRLSRATRKQDISLPLGGDLVLDPSLSLARARLGASSKIDGGFAFSGRFTGTLDWRAGRLDGSTSMALDLDADFEVQVRPAPDDASGSEGAGLEAVAVLHHVSVVAQRPRKLPRLDLDLDLRAQLVEGLESHLLGGFPELPLMSASTGDLPARALRVHPEEKGLRFEVLLPVPVAGAAPAPPLQAPPLQDADWALTIDSEALVALARRAAFERGPQQLEIVPDPRSLALTESGFTLGLRLWRLAGRGWWRDYTVRGHLGLDGHRIRLDAEEVQEVDHSKGAAVADPLAALARGRILEAIEQAAHGTRPGTRRQDVAGMAWTFKARQVGEHEGALLVAGTARARTPGKSRPSKSRGEDRSGKTGGKRSGGRP